MVLKGIFERKKLWGTLGHDPEAILPRHASGKWNYIVTNYGRCFSKLHSIN